MIRILHIQYRSMKKMILKKDMRNKDPVFIVNMRNKDPCNKCEI